MHWHSTLSRELGYCNKIHFLSQFSFAASRLCVEGLLAISIQDKTAAPIRPCE